MDDVSRARAHTLARILDAIAKELVDLFGDELRKAFPGGLSESLAAEDSAEDRDRLGRRFGEPTAAARSPCRRQLCRLRMYSDSTFAASFMSHPPCCHRRLLTPRIR